MSEEMKIRPDNNLVWAILCTVLCCLPLGIVAIIKAASVENLWLQGRETEAQQAANDAKKYATWGVISSVVFWIIYVIIIVIFAVAAS